MNSSKFFKFFFYSCFFYIFLSLLIYLISAFFLIGNKVINYKIILDFQRNFYHQIGFRNIWNSQIDCIEFDKNLIYIPKKGNCNFNNVEFSTLLNFNEEGRSNNNLSLNVEKKDAIALIGDSFSMGWGVNDNETFSSILEKKINRKIYNLGVASYATEREIIRLKEFKYLDDVSTIIIQYCDNDYGENFFYKKNNLNNNSISKFEEIFTNKLSIYEKFRKIIRYSIVIPLEVLFLKKNNKIDWKVHEELFENILQNYSFLKDKNIIVIYTNSFGKKFFNFPNALSKKIYNLTYINIDYEENDFYILDGHLNKKGHEKIASKLAAYLENFNIN